MGDPAARSGPEGVLPYPSRNPFEFFHVLRGLDEAPEQPMWGTLILPPAAAAPVPAVICCHGSLGWRGHHHEHMVRLLEAGIAVFRIHSFDAREVKSIVENQMAVTMAMVLVDAYRGLEQLAAHPAIDASRVGIMGWSLGGSVALYSAWEPLREAIVGASGPRFAAHLPLYPAAHLRPEEMRWGEAPMRVLIGEADDYTPAHFVTGWVPELREAGVPIEVFVYPGAHHSFDSIEPLAYLPDAVRLGKRTVTVGRDGHVFVRGSDGSVHLLDEPAQRSEGFRRGNVHGAHIGGSWTMRARALRDAEAFFRGVLQPKRARAQQGCRRKVW